MDKNKLIIGASALFIVIAISLVMMFALGNEEEKGREVVKTTASEEKSKNKGTSSESMVAPSVKAEVPSNESDADGFLKLRAKSFLLWDKEHKAPLGNVELLLNAEGIEEIPFVTDASGTFTLPADLLPATYVLSTADTQGYRVEALQVRIGGSEAFVSSALESDESGSLRVNAVRRNVLRVEFGWYQQTKPDYTGTSLHIMIGEKLYTGELREARQSFYFIFYDIPVGEGILLLQSETHSLERPFPVFVAEGGISVNTLSISLTEDLPLTGTIKDQQGKPVVGVRLTLMVSQSSLYQFSVGHGWHSGFDGGFSIPIRNKKRGRSPTSPQKGLVLQAYGGNKGIATHDIKSFDERIELVLKDFEYDHCSVQVLDEEDNPISGAKVRFFEPQWQGGRTESTGGAPAAPTWEVEMLTNEFGVAQTICPGRNMRAQIKLDGWDFGLASRFVGTTVTEWSTDPKNARYGLPAANPRKNTRPGGGNILHQLITGVKGESVNISAPVWQRGDAILIRKADPSPQQDSSLEGYHIMEMPGTEMATIPLAAGRWAIAYRTRQGILSHAEIVEVEIGKKHKMTVSSREQDKLIALPKDVQKFAAYGFVGYAGHQGASLFQHNSTHGGRLYKEMLANRERLTNNESMRYVDRSPVTFRYVPAQGDALVPESWVTFGMHFLSIGLCGASDPGSPSSLKCYHRAQKQVELSIGAYAFEVTPTKLEFKLAEGLEMEAPWVVTNCGLFPVGKKLDIFIDAKAILTLVYQARMPAEEGSPIADFSVRMGSNSRNALDPAKLDEVIVELR